MHPKSAEFIAFCDGEAGAGRGMQKHLAKCEKCRDEVRRIRSEKETLAAGFVAPGAGNAAGLSGVLSAMAAWRRNRSAEAASELRSRLRWQIETYCGAPALRMLDQPELRTEELLGKTGEMLDIFLGPRAGEAVRDEVFRGLDWAALAGETER